MGAKSGIALKSLQWFFRAIQFLSAAIILGIFSYFLATLHNHHFTIGNSLRAVEGISGAAALYTLVGLVLLWCVAGHTMASLIAIILDFCFMGAFIYVAVVNKNGAGSCKGYLDTPFGTGNSDNKADSDKGFTVLPSFHTACRLQTASMAIAIILVFFFIFSLLLELALVRHHRKEKRFGPGPQNGYTSGSGSRKTKTAGAGGFLSRFRRNKKNKTAYDESGRLPEHTHPDQLEAGRYSQATETTAVTNDGRGPSADYQKQEVGYGYQPGTATTTNTVYNAGHGHGGWHTAPHTTNAPARYDDGVYDRP